MWTNESERDEYDWYGHGTKIVDEKPALAGLLTIGKTVKSDNKDRRDDNLTCHARLHDTVQNGCPVFSRKDLKNKG